MARARSRPSQRKPAKLKKTTSMRADYDPRLQWLLEKEQAEADFHPWQVSKTAHGTTVVEVIAEVRDPHRPVPGLTVHCIVGRKPPPTSGKETLVDILAVRARDQPCELTGLGSGALLSFIRNPARFARLRATSGVLPAAAPGAADPTAWPAETSAARNVRQPRDRR